MPLDGIKIEAKSGDSKVISKICALRTHISISMVSACLHGVLKTDEVRRNSNGNLPNACEFVQQKRNKDIPWYSEIYSTVTIAS